MARLTKYARRALWRGLHAGLSGLSRHLPRGLQGQLAPMGRYADMLLGDHLIIRLVFPNRHRLGDRAWRSAQPLPHQIRDMAKRGVKSVVNLRWDFKSTTYALEKEACAAAGIRLVDFRVRSRQVPQKEELLRLKELFETLEYPVLFHCKSGSDRAGLMSALYLHAHCGVPIDEAMGQLSLRYGHIKHADTGVLDHFLDCYRADIARTPMGFFEWVERVYDADAVTQSFKANGWANRIVNSVLKRE